MIAIYEHSSLFGLVISNEGKKFYNINTWNVPQLDVNLSSIDLNSLQAVADVHWDLVQML